MTRLNLPSPRRTVRRGVRLCQRLGYDEGEALVLLSLIAHDAAKWINVMGEYDTAWVMDIKLEAECQLRALRQRHK